VRRWGRPPSFTAAILALLAGCEPQGDRPALSSLGPAVTVDPTRLVGTWRCRDLNPYPDQPSQVITTDYAADGTFRSSSVIPGRGPLGAIEVAQRGRWSVANDELVTDDIKTEARSVDGNTETDAYAKASAELIDAMGRDRPAASEVLRLDERRLTLRPVDVTDPPVIGCTRS
jgi:hypothetical protein